MRNKKYYISLTTEERQEIIRSLIAKKNQLIRTGKYTDAVDDVLLKVIKARIKKFKIKSA